MRFLIDENVPIQVMAWLQEKGHDAKRVPSGTKNGNVLALATSELRVVLTQDKDFANRLQYPPANYHGLIVFRIHPPIVEQLISGLQKLLNEGPSEFSKKLVILEMAGFHLLDS
jgi:predicted nuclease of predicted toxin-antitoxin system